MAIRTNTRQVPAHTLDIDVQCEFGTVTGIHADESTVTITTENGTYPLPASKLVWLTTAGK